MRLIPPRTPLDQPHSHACREGVLVPDAVSLVTIRYGELPYSQAITATTPSLHVQLDRLSLTLEFVQVFSGQLSIEEVEGTLRSKTNHLIDIRDIPTTTELQLRCSDNSGELIVQLQNGQKGVVYFTFAWFQRDIEMGEVKDGKVKTGEDTGASSSGTI
jgi:hypothetical protein